MSGKRHLRLGHQLRDEISGYLQKGLLKDPRIGFASISGVRLSKDLRHAKVFVSVFGSDEESTSTVLALQNARSFIRRQLGKDLHIRRVPDLTFVQDDSIAEGIRISQIVDQVISQEESAKSEDDEYSDDLDDENPPHLPDERMNADTALTASEAPSLPTETVSESLSWEPIVKAISDGQRFLLTGHRHPDGDSLGAVTGLYGVLKALGKEAVIFNDAPLPEQFHFLPYAELTQTSIAPDDRFDVTILCDCGSANRAGHGFPSSPEQRGTFVVIDHHQTSEMEGDVIYNDPSAAAVGMLIYELAQALDVTITQDIAKSLYTAILSDTGSFRYDKTNPHVLRVAADLLETGIKPWDISSALYESAPIARQRLLARTLDTLDILADGKLATIHITSDMFDATGALPHMTDGFINFARGIKGVEVAVMFRKQEGGWKLSFRSRGRINVADVASQLGGGGHRNAAGTFLNGSLEDVKESVCESLMNVLQKEFLSVEA